MDTSASPPLFGIILAGGSGTRFWPWSRAQYPKPVLRLLGSDSLLQATCARLLPRIPPERLVVVTSVSQAQVIRLDLQRQSLSGVRLWLEPEAKNTAPAVALAAACMGPKADAEIMAVFPADHYIRDTAALHQALDTGAALAREGWLVAFGVSPTRPETGYGYLKAGKNLAAGGRQVLAFIEKPDLPRARAFLAEGDYFWNSGIFLFRRDIFLAELARFLPEVHRELAGVTPDTPLENLEAIYRRLPSISLDHGIMEHTDRLALVPVDLGWSDVGTWSALYDVLPPDPQGNIIQGRVLDMGSRDCLIFAQDRLVATLGLREMIVVDTADATLVCPRDRVQEVKHLVAEITRRNHQESREHPRVERPWGRYTVMLTGPGYKVIQVVVDPGRRLCLKGHRHRAEHWVVVQGVAWATIGPEVKEVPPHQSVYIPAGTPYRLENPGPDPLVLIEIQTGDYLEEDDLVRLKDDLWSSIDDSGFQVSGQNCKSKPL